MAADLYDRLTAFLPDGMKTANRWGLVSNNKSPLIRGAPEWHFTLDEAVKEHQRYSNISNFRNKINQRVIGYCFGDVSRLSKAVATDPDHDNNQEGYLIMKPDPRFGCIDYDHVLDEKTHELVADLSPALREEIDTFTTAYRNEISGSGTGLHIIFEKREGWPEFNKKIDAQNHREIFSGANYVNFTGNVWKQPSGENIEAAYALLLRLVTDQKTDPKQPKQQKNIQTKESSESSEFIPTGLSKEEWAEWNKRHNAVEICLRNGYILEGDRLKKPNSSHTAGVMILDEGKAVYSHHAGDPLCTETKHDAFDCMRILECGNDKLKAINRIKQEIGILSPVTQSGIPVWERTNIIRGFDIVRYTYTDEGNACRFEDECKGWLIFDKFNQQWFAWMGNYWELAEERLIQSARFVGKTVASESKFQKEVSKQFLSHAKNAENLKSQEAMVKMAKANMSINLPDETDYTLLACKNGIIDCLTGDFYSLNECDQFRNKYPTAYVDASYIQNSDPAKWINHLNMVMDDNSTERLSDEERNSRKDDLVKYLLRLFGYALYAGNPERIFVFLWGKGRNGKSTTMQVLTSILGTQSANPTLTQLYAVDTDKPAPSIAAALPKRVAIFSEAEGESKISVSAFKEITGEISTERFRMMRQNNQRIPIMCLPIGTTNDIPQFDKPMDQALLNRLVTIPFNHIFESENREVFNDLMTEKDAIFSLMVDELKMYLHHGLIPAPDCTSTTQQELLIGEDLYVFLTQVIEPSSEEKMTKNDVKAKYLQWATDSGVEVNTHFELDIYGQKLKVLNKSETNRLYAALRIMGYKEGRTSKERYVYARDHAIPKDYKISGVIA